MTKHFIFRLAILRECNEGDESAEEAHFRTFVFNVLLDTVIGRLTVRSSAAKKIYDKFYFCVELPDDGFRASGRESQVIG